MITECTNDVTQRTYHSAPFFTPVHSASLFKLFAKNARVQNASALFFIFALTAFRTFAFFQ